MSDARYPIQLVARLTGLSPFVLRIWEQRYRAVEPERTAGNRRLYSEKDIARLRLLREITEGGWSIGQVARLPDSELRNFPVKPPGDVVAPAGPERGSWGAGLERCLAAIRGFNRPALEDALRQAHSELGGIGVLERLAAPLAQAVGDLWRTGQITAAHEHFATGILRGFLANLEASFGRAEGGPRLVVATPAGQLHELGALLAGAIAAHLGWQVTQLGASLPAPEIAGAARETGARAVALSLVYPEDDSRLPGELALLRQLMPAEAALLAGGRAAPAYRGALGLAGAILTPDFTEFGLALDRLRQPAAASAKDGP